MDRETILILRVLGVIAVIVACLFGFGAKDPAVAIVFIIFSRIIIFIIKITIKNYENSKIVEDSYSVPGYTRSASQSNQSKTASVKKIDSNAATFTQEEILNAVVLPEETELDPKELVILKTLSNRSMTSQEILSRVPRSANIYEYKDALVHLKEIGAVRLEDNGRYSIVLSEEFLKQKAIEQNVQKSIIDNKRKEEERIRLEKEAEIRENGIYYKEEDLTPQEKFVLNIVEKRKTRAQDILKMIPRDDELTPYKEAINHLKSIEAINANPDGVLVYNESFFILSGQGSNVTAETRIKTDAIEKTTKNETAKTPVETELKDAPDKTVAAKSAPDYTATLTEEDIKRIAGNAANIAEMFKARFSGPFGLDNKKILMLSAGMAGYACHQAVMANKLPYNLVTAADGRKFYMGDSVNKYLLDGKYSVLSWCDGFFETAGKFFAKPDPTEVVKKEVNAVENKEYRIWDSESPVVTYKEVRACWEGIYENMTARYCNKPDEWPVLYGIVLQNIMLEVSRIMTISDVYEKALECAIYISRMDEDSI